MNQFKKTLWYVFTHDIKNLVLFSFFMIIYIPMHYYNITKKMDESSELFNQIILIYFLSVVFSFFIFSGISQLKKTYIYLINKQYQQHLKKITIIVATVFGLIMVLIFSNNINISILYFLIVVTAVANINYSRGNGSTLVDFIIFGFPLFLLLRDKFMFSQNILLIMTVIHVSLLLFMAFYNYNKSNVISLQTQKDIDRSEIGMELCGGPLNYKLGKIITKFKGFYKGKIDFAVTAPATRLGIFGLVFFILIIFGFLFGKRGDMSIGVSTSILLALFFLFTPLGLKNLIIQTTKVAHVFNGKNHKQLKYKILFAIDKVLLLNSLVLVVCTIITIQLFILPMNLQYILISTLAIFLFGMAYYPIVISVDITPVIRILPTLAYVVLMILLIFWLYHNFEKAQKLEYAIPYYISCLTLRIISQNMFWKTPYEKLIKVNYENIK